MSKNPDNSLFFSDGIILSPETVIASGQFNALPNADVSRIVMRFSGSWVRKDCKEDMIRSITYSHHLGKCFFMGRNGYILSAGTQGEDFSLESIRGTFHDTTLADVEDYGELFCIRAIGRYVYACGQSSQVYVFDQGTWSHIDTGILSENGETLESIDGTGPDDIYAVGLSGTALHFDGRHWQKIDLPTNQPLACVRCISPNDVYICGNSGLLFRGSGNTWLDLTEDEMPNFWGLEEFQGELYLSYVRGLYKYDGQVFTELDLGFNRPMSCCRLQSTDAYLLSTGVNDIIMFNGQSWTEIIWPDNQP